MSTGRDYFRKIIEEFLRDSPAAHKRRCAIRHGVREPTEIECDCQEHWSASRHWCDNCGTTLNDVMMRRPMDDEIPP